MTNEQRTQVRFAKKKAVLDRITALLSKNGIQHKELIEYLQLPIGTYSNWIRGKGFAYVLYIDEIAEYLNVSVSYLLTGQEPSEDLPDDRMRPDEIELLKKYNSLTRKTQKAVIEIVDALERNLN